MNRIFTLLLLISGLCINAQDRLDQALQLLESSYSQEKIYVLTDKEQYVAGDQIWFKAFAFEGYRKSGISGTLFVELYDRDNKVLESRTIALTQGEGHGNIKLKDDIGENVYYLRAHTPWMSNFSQEFDFIKPLAVYNPSSAQKLDQTNNISWTASAVPEGNNLIENMDTRIAVRMFSTGVPPRDWQGYLVDSSRPQEKLVSFKGLDQNVGHFSFTPKSSTQYSVVVEDPVGGRKEINLPAVKKSGVSLKVNTVQEGTKYTLKARELPQGLQNYKVIGTINNKLAYRANIKKPSGEISVTIPSKINEGKAGILLLSIFDENDALAAQRLVFINHDQSKPQKTLIKNLSADMNPRSVSRLEMNKSPGDPPATLLIKDGSTDTSQEKEHDLLSTLWLTGDLKSPIHAPAQYFSENAKAEALDALLIADKWTRFNWNVLLEGKKPIIKSPPGKYLFYEGRLALNSRPLPNRNITVMSKSDSGELSFAPLTTDAKGSVFLNNIFLDEPLKITYFLEGTKKDEPVPDNLTLKFQSMKPAHFKGQFPSTSYRLVQRSSREQTSPAVAKAIANRKNEDILYADAALIEEVQLYAKKKDLAKKLEKELSSSMFTSVNSTVFDFVNEDQHAETATNILDWLQSRAAGLTVERDGSGNSVPIIRGTRAKLFLDEFPADPTMISGLPISSIAMVKVVRGASVVGDAVLIYTRRGNMGSHNTTTPSKNNHIVLTGYDRPMEPDIVNLTKTLQNKIQQDSREVLYWNPLQTNSPVEFLNNDSTSAFRIVAIGFDEKGNPLFYDKIHRN